MSSGEGAAKSPRSSEKRVRFITEDNDAVRLAGAGAPKRARRGGDAMQELAGEIGAVCLAGGGRGDARAAAALRARQRRAATLALFEDPDALEPADAAALDAWAADGAAGYEGPGARGEGGAAAGWEPFHLREEEDAGYFDEETGEYVAHKRDEVEDAWVDELPDSEVDREWARRVLRGKGPAAAQAAEAVEDLAPAQLRALKEQVAELLRPGENVLAALRRLGASRLPVPAQAPGAGPAPPEEGGPGAPRRPPATPMPAPVKREFDRLTECGLALMEAGVYEIHSLSREEILSSLGGGAPSERLVQGAPGAAAARRGGAAAPPPAPADGEQDTCPDMFAGGEGEQAQCTGAAAGFALDPSTGYMYNSTLGAYFDQESKLFGDASNGRWYAVDAAGAYRPAPAP